MLLGRRDELCLTPRELPANFGSMIYAVEGSALLLQFERFLSTQEDKMPVDKVQVRVEVREVFVDCLSFYRKQSTAVAFWTVSYSFPKRERQFIYPVLL